jgi:hypothetical protein
MSPVHFLTRILPILLPIILLLLPIRRPLRSIILAVSSSSLSKDGVELTLRMSVLASRIDLDVMLK